MFGQLNVWAFYGLTTLYMDMLMFGELNVWTFYGLTIYGHAYVWTT